MNLLHLRYFYEVARTRSFTESARNLRISQPAISKMVRNLEGSLSQVLLERGGREVRLTEPGEVLFHSASKIFAEAADAQEKLKASVKDLTGEWTLGASDNIALHLIPGVLGRFKEKHPRLRIGLFSGTSSQIKTELHYDRCRLGFFFTPLKGNEPFEWKQILETEFWIVIASKNRWTKKGRVSLEDLKRLEVPRIESRHSDYARGFPAHFHSKRLGLTTSPWLEVNQHEIKRKLVLDGFGYALLTRHTVEDDVKHGLLTRLKCGQELRAPIFAVWKRGREMGRISEMFLKDLGGR